MIEELLILLHDGTKYASYTSGVNGVTKIFFDREDKNTVVVTGSESIETFTGFLFVCQKAYKKKEIEG